MRHKKITISTISCVLCAIGCGLWILNMAAQAGAADEADTKIDLEKIIVTPSKFAQYYTDIPVNVDIIDAEDIDESGASEVTDTLDTISSVDVVDYGSYGATKSVHIRGASSSQVITLIDGRPAYTPRDGVTDYNQIPLNNIERIEVLKGPASNIYGANAVGGVVNIITKSGKKKMFTELNVRSGSYLTALLDFAHGWKVGSLDYFITTNYTTSEGYRDNSDYLQRNYALKLGYDVGDDNRLIFGSGYASSRTGTPGRIQDPDLDDRQNQWQNYLDLTWDGSLWQDSKILIKGYKNYDRLDFIENQPTPSAKDSHKTGVYGMDLQLSQEWFDMFRTSLGLDGQENKLDSSTSGKHKYNFRAAYFESELELFKDLTLKGGVRVDDYSNFGSSTSPSASFAWWFFDKVKAHGLAAKAFRAPTFNDLYWPREDWGAWGGVEGNPNLRPEKVKSYEFGIGTALHDTVETDITYFYNRYRSMIAWTMDDSFWWRPTNVNTAIIKGVEANINYDPVKNLKLNLNYTRLSAIDKNTRKWIVYRPRHELKGTVNYGFSEKLNLWLTGKFSSKRYTTESNSTFLKNYFVADANISYKIIKSAEISLTVKNILDRDYQEEEGYPMPGTSFLVGTKVTF